MAQWAEHMLPKPDGPNSIPGTHRKVEEETKSCPLTYMCIYTHVIHREPQQKLIIIVMMMMMMIIIIVKVKVFVRFVEAGHYPRLPGISYGNQSGLEFTEIYCL